MSIKKYFGIFFGKKKTGLTEEKVEEALQIFAKYIPLIRKIMRSDDDGTLTSDGNIIGQMYDFYKEADNTLPQTRDEFLAGTVPNVQMISANLAENQQNTIRDMRIEATPLSVKGELGTVPLPFTLENLDNKIALLKDKSKLVNQFFSKEQIKGLCKRLENRKNYLEHVEFFTAYPYTTDEKIDTLLSKYKLVMKESDLFVPTFPKEAIDIMKEYEAHTKSVSRESAVFYVIAEEKDFDKKFKKLDPILLAQSPFGFYWQILGAWDKEMLLLTEL